MGVAVLVRKYRHKRRAELRGDGGEWLSSSAWAMTNHGSRTADLFLTPSSLGYGGRRAVGNLGNVGEGIGEKADRTRCCDQPRPD